MRRRCCCKKEEGCDCPTQGPQADFSYLQISNDPCVFIFTDESTSGECGQIVSYLWDFGDGTTSTEQSPTHTYSDAGPWFVSLTVTDASECQDAAMMYVGCHLLCVSCPDGQMPDIVKARLLNLDPSSGPLSYANCECNFIKDVEFSLIRVGECVWRLQKTIIDGDELGTCGVRGQGYYTRRVFLDFLEFRISDTSMELTGVFASISDINGDGKYTTGFPDSGSTWSFQYRKLRPASDDCLGLHDLSVYYSQSPFFGFNCDRPAYQSIARIEI